MAINSVRTALQLLSGAGEVTRAKAMEAAVTLLELPGVGETSARAGQLAEELLAAATANQAMVTELVRTEVDGRLSLLGLARGRDLDAAQSKIDALEREVAELRRRVAAERTSSSRSGASAAAKAPAKKAATTTKKKTAKKSTAKKTSTAAAKKTTAKKTATKTTVKTAKKAPAQKAVGAATKRSASRTS